VDDTGLPHWHATFAASCDARTATVYARGSLDLFTVEYLRGAVDIVRRAGHVDVHIQAADLIAIDRAGLAYVQALAVDLDRFGGSLTFHDVPERLRRDIVAATSGR